jgi:hypothetical protein
MIKSLLKTISVTLELKPEVEACAIEHAASRGVPVEAFLEAVIEDTLNAREGKPLDEMATAEECEATLDEFADSPTFSKAAPLIDDSRAEIYRQQEDSQL